MQEVACGCDIGVDVGFVDGVGHRGAGGGDGVPDAAVEQEHLAGVGQRQDEGGEALRAVAGRVRGEAELDAAAEPVDGPREPGTVDLVLQSGLKPPTERVDGGTTAGIGTADGVLVSVDDGLSWSTLGVEDATSIAWFQGALWIAGEAGMRIWSYGTVVDGPSTDPPMVLLAGASDARALWGVSRDGVAWRTSDGLTWVEHGAVNAVEALAATTDAAYAPHGPLREGHPGPVGNNRPSLVMR